MLASIDLTSSKSSLPYVDAHGRCKSRRFFLLLLRTRTCAIGAEALSLSCFSICTFFGRAAPERVRERVPTSRNGLG